MKTLNASSTSLGKASFAVIATLLSLSASAEVKTQDFIAKGPLTELGQGVLGEQKTLVFLINFKDLPTYRPYEAEDVKDLVFRQLNDYYYENSFHQMKISGDVVGYYTVSAQSGSDCETIIRTIRKEVPAMASEGGVDVASYPRRIYVFPRARSCPWNGLGTVGAAEGSEAWINGAGDSFFDVGHEIGHNLGVFHDGALRCSNGVLSGKCRKIEYANPSSMMGNSVPAHFSAFQKEQLGWLKGSNGPSITNVTQSGTYVIEPLETFSTGAKALKILKGIRPDGSKDYYYIELRTNYGFDQVLSSSLLNGVIVTLANDTDRNSNRLLDMTPNTATFFDAALAPGRSFADPAGGMTLTLKKISSEGAILDVKITQDNR